MQIDWNSKDFWMVRKPLCDIIRCGSSQITCESIDCIICSCFRFLVGWSGACYAGMTTAGHVDGYKVVAISTRHLVYCPTSWKPIWHFTLIWACWKRFVCDFCCAFLLYPFAFFMVKLWSEEQVLTAWQITHLIIHVDPPIDPNRSIWTELKNQQPKKTHVVPQSLPLFKTNSPITAKGLPLMCVIHKSAHSRVFTSTLLKHSLKFFAELSVGKIACADSLRVLLRLLFVLFRLSAF